MFWTVTAELSLKKNFIGDIFDKTFQLVYWEKEKSLYTSIQLVHKRKE